jgi:hypothetical protein
MPLSTVLGAQSLVQPAVCTTATRPASPYTGQAIYDTTVSQVLVYNGTAFAPVSRVLQVVSVEYTTATNTTSTTYVTTGLNASITPSSSSSKILVFASGALQNSGSGTAVRVSLFRGTVAGTNLATGSNVKGMGYAYPTTIGGYSCMTLDSPATTSATTYTVGFATGNGTVTATVQPDTISSTMVLMEISA